MRDSSSSSSVSDSTNLSWFSNGLLAGASVATATVAYAAISRRRSARFGSQVLGIIPARFASSRFPGKSLVPILGKPMIQVLRGRGKEQNWQRRSTSLLWLLIMRR